LDKKKRHHYVWRFYLKSWANKESIFCKMNNKIFQSNLMGIGQEKYFYKLNDLTDKEKVIIQKLAINSSPKHLKKLHNNFVNGFTSIYNLKKLFNKELENDNKIAKLFEMYESNMNEDYHSEIESLNIKYIEKLLDKNINFFTCEEDRISFSYYIATQFFRTKKMKNNVINAVGNNKLVDIEKIWPILAHIFSTNLGHSIFIDKKFRLVLLVNKTNLEFITGDQPIINTYAVGKLINEEIKELEFYYPLSPKIALLVTEDKKYKEQIINISDNTIINFYNTGIIKESNTQIYASNREILENIN
jgi:hypothetical protein